MLFYPNPTPAHHTSYHLIGQLVNSCIVVTEVVPSDVPSITSIIGHASTLALANSDQSIQIIIDPSGYPIGPPALLNKHPLVLYRPPDPTKHHLYSLTPIDIHVRIREEGKANADQGSLSQVLDIVGNLFLPWQLCSPDLSPL